MDLETSQLLRRLTELTEENNKILLNVQKHARWETFFTTVKWILFIALTIGSYFAVQPYIGQVVDTYRTINSTQVQSQNLNGYLKNVENSVKYGVPAGS
jgi:hypothetical protein